MNQIRSLTDYNTIVKVERTHLFKYGSGWFIKEYLKYDYGYLFNSCYMSPELKKERVFIILPVSLNYESCPLNFYVNAFKSEYCKIELNTEFNSLINMALDERVSKFSENPYMVF